MISSMKLLCALPLCVLPAVGSLTGCKHADGPRSESGVKIAGGDEVDADEPTASATVALLRPDGSVFCSGVLISPTHVLSAAHCRKDFAGEVAYVAFGPVAKKDQLPAGSLIAASFRGNEDFQRSIMFGGLPDRPVNDIALLTLTAPAPPAHKPAVLLQMADDVAVGETVVIAGFGLISAMPSQRSSSGTLRQTETSLVKLSPASKEVLIKGRSDNAACNGDSGGPVYVRRGQDLKLLGVTSRGTGMPCQSDTVYTDVRYFSAWLQQQL